jgi:hypothetical protein
LLTLAEAAFVDEVSTGIPAKPAEMTTILDFNRGRRA